jgi:hypothetical protein
MLYRILAFAILGLSTALAIEPAPATRVSVVTNNFRAMGVLTPTNTVQAALDALDWQVFTNNVVNTNEHARYDSSLVTISNIANSALEVASSATGTAQSAKTYVYSRSGTVVVTNCTAGQAYFYTDLPSLSRLVVGMVVSGTVFKAATTITNIDYTATMVRTDSNMNGSTTSGTNHTFYGTGVYTHVVPAPYTRSRVYVTGGGGSGGSASGNTAAGGGAAGGTAIGYFSDLPGSSFTITVGAGAAGPSTGGGTSGGTSSFEDRITATGGNGGSVAGDIAGSTGGIASGGTLNLTGGPGGNVSDYSDSGVFADAENGGEGGTSFWGGGGASSQEETAGSPGTAYGSGGSGAGDSGSTRVGGAGAQGVIVIEYY